MLFALPGALSSQIFAWLTLPCISGLGSNVTSSEGPALSCKVAALSCKVLHFLGSTYPDLDLHLFASLLNICLTLKTESFLKVRALLVPHTAPSTGHRACRCVLDGQLPSLSLPFYHVLFSRLSVFLSVPVSLCFSLTSFTFFSDSSVSHFHVFLCVCLSLSHTHLHPLPGPGTWNIFVL